jgi:FtsP/CotA-like multicopper oxidase with cupredoxin domain
MYIDNDYFNVFGERISRKRFRQNAREAETRRELIAAKVSRRDMMKMGLLTGAGLLAPMCGISARAQSTSSEVNQANLQNSTGITIPVGQPEFQNASPRVTPFVAPLPIMGQAQFSTSPPNPAPTVQPNTAAGEGRTVPSQSLLLFPPKRYYQMHQQAVQVRTSPSYPVQNMWGFNDSHGNISTPGPTYVANYGIPQLTRNFNNLPPEADNGGFGVPSVTTHLHNGHTPSESDGNPADFFEIGQFYDQHYPNVYAGILSTNPGTGDINEALSTLWYHDHRMMFTSQNTYKGLVGFYLLFNQFDTGDEESGFRLPSYPEFDIPMVFADKVYDASATLAFDLFNIDGILGDRFHVNGQIQPFLEVQPRRYRFRWLNTGPSRFYEYFLTDPTNLGAANPYWQISNDGNLLPNGPIELVSTRIGPAERVDVIVDFSQFAGKTIYLENRLEQLNGTGPTGNILPAGAGNLLLQFRVAGGSVPDHSLPPNEITQFYPLPTVIAPVVTRTFNFARLNGMWSINGEFFDPTAPRFTVTRNTAENWILTNLTGDWTHPIHIHLEEHQLLSRNGVARPGGVLPTEVARKDVQKVPPNSRVQLFFRFRDWVGKYPLHCHNVVHEDHSMMLRWDIQPDGDTNRNP